MQSRIVSSFVLWTALLGSVYYFQGKAIAVWIILTSLGGQRELSKILQGSGLGQSRFDLCVAGFFPFLVYCLPTTEKVLGCLYFGFITAICLNALRYSKNAKGLIGSIFSFAYIAFNLHFCLLILKTMPTFVAIKILVWMVIITKATDIGGLFVGCTYGKHKLAPNVSPQKSWEGCLGGILLACILGMGIPFFSPSFVPFSLQKACLFSILLSLGAILADLVESLLKRQSQQKDSGRFIPGIGGILDLIDSLLFNAPLGYFLLKYFVVCPTVK